MAPRMIRITSRNGIGCSRYALNNFQTDLLRACSPRYYERAMTANAERILTDALTLPEDDRVKIAAELLASIDTEADRDVTAAWAAEIERREADVLAGR